MKKTIQNRIHSEFLILSVITFLNLFFSLSCFFQFPAVVFRKRICTGSVSVPRVVNNSVTSRSKPCASDGDLPASQFHSIKSHDCLHFTLWIQTARSSQNSIRLEILAYSITSHMQNSDDDVSSCGPVRKGFFSH